MISIIAFTANGCSLAEKVARFLGDECKTFSKTKADHGGTIPIEGSLAEWTRDAMAVSEAVIFISATGVAVRSIAPYLKDKITDPAVICMDDTGKFVISLLSGHVGGANRMAVRIAASVGGIPVVTTATDVHGKFAVDEFAVTNGMRFNNKAVAKEISARLLDGGVVGFKTDYPYLKELPDGVEMRESGDLGILISSRYNPLLPFDKTLVLAPRNYILGIGCKKNTPYEVMKDLVDRVLKDNKISHDSISVIASIDLKKDEPAIKELGKYLKAPLVFYTSDELNSLEDIGFSSSEFVKSITDVDCVCERSAVMASPKGKLICRKTAENGVTVAIVKDIFEVRFG